MHISKGRLFFIPVFQVSLFFALLTSVWAEDLTWEEDPAFAKLQDELREVAATQNLCKTYLDFHDRNPEAASTLLSLRNIITTQIFRGQSNLVLSPLGHHHHQNNHPNIPSILAPPQEVSQLSEKLLAGFKARKTAYTNLIQTTESITELSLISVCFLHQMEIIPDEEAFNRLLSHYKKAINNESSALVTQITIDRKSNTRLEAAVVLIQLATRLDRIDEITDITKDVPQNNTSWAARQVQRLLNLIPIYSTDEADHFVEIGTESLINREISFLDLEAAAAFKEHPLSTVSKIYIALLGAEKPRSPRLESILNLLRRSPPSDSALLLNLLNNFMTSKAVSPTQKSLLINGISHDEELEKRYGKFIPTLIEKLLTSTSDLTDRSLLPYLPFFANFISLKLAEEPEVEKWREIGQKLITSFVEASTDKKIDESYADQLLNIALSCGTDELLEEVTVKTAQSFTWPFERVYHLLKKGKTSAAFAMMDHGIQDNLFPLHLVTKVPAELITIAEATITREPDQRNTFISMLFIHSILRNKQDESQRKRALELLEVITSRWGEIDHPNESFLQQGNRVLWRQQVKNMEPAIPALRLWAERNPITSLLKPKTSPLRLSNAKQEVWRRCLNSGYFEKEVTWIADLLIETGIRGDAKAHRKMNDILVDMVSSGNSTKGCPAPLSSYYVFVKTWLMIHTDPPLHSHPSPWQRMREELTGLGLSPEETASMMLDVLSGLLNTNQNKSLSPVHHTALLAELTQLKDPVLEARLLARHWKIKTWIPISQGEPEAVLREIDTTLGETQHREVWASLLFSSAYIGVSLPELRAFSDEEKAKIITTWIEGFRQAATGTWLEDLVNRYLESYKRASNLILYPLGNPEILQELDQLPLGLRYKIATHEKLAQWFESNPAHLKTALPICVDSICETILKAPENAKAHYLWRYYSIGQLDRIMLPDYQKNAATFRPLYSALRKAADVANARHQNDNNPALKPLRKLLLQIETLDDELVIDTE